MNRSGLENILNSDNDYHEAKNLILGNFDKLTDQQCILYESATNNHYEIYKKFIEEQEVSIKIDGINVDNPAPIIIPESPLPSPHIVNTSINSEITEV